MRHWLHLAAAAGLFSATAWAHAADFDGSQALLCAPVQAIDCAAGRGCVVDIPANLGAPNFMHIDFEQKLVVGAKYTMPILHMEKADDQILLQGTELAPPDPGPI